jgi:hypothetical protein
MVGASPTARPVFQLSATPLRTEFTESEAHRDAAVRERDNAPSNRLPSPLIGSIGRLSGLSLHDVAVHRGSDRPGKVGANAYATANDIYLAPGQEGRLAHEAWHLVQQRQRRITPTLHSFGVDINDDPHLESEADKMGARAVRLAAGEPGVSAQTGQTPQTHGVRQAVTSPAIMQRDIKRDPNTNELIKEGRVKGHDRALNKQALSALIQKRAASAGNNDVEQGLQSQYQKKGGRVGRGGHADMITGKLGKKYAICHKISDFIVQRNIITASKTGHSILITKMIKAIKPIIMGVPIFDSLARQHYDDANSLLKSMTKSGLKNMDPEEATTLAGLIANSPMNLFVGNQPVNASIGSKFDFNTRRKKANKKAKKPTLTRAMTPRSFQIDTEMGEAHTQTSSTSDGVIRL